jgi:argininosuccinate synthase
MKLNGVLAYAYTADLAQPDETDYEGIPAKARAFGAANARLVDCKRYICE